MRLAHVAGRVCLQPVVAIAILTAVTLLPQGHLTAQQVIPGNNVNMVSGTEFPTGDPFLQRQNEPSLAVSTRNPLHLLAGANDYRTVDLQGPFDPLRGEKLNADAWLGLFKSIDGGRTWQSTLVPGFPQDISSEGLASPIKGRQAGTDPVVRAGTNGLFYYAGLAFDRGVNAPSTIFVARFIDLNNREAGDPIAYLGTHTVDSNPGTRFLDKTALAVDVPRTGATCTITTPRDDGGTDTQTIPAGPVYVAYSSFTGSGTSLRSDILFSRSLDCGASWSAPTNVSIGNILNQNAQIAINPTNGHIWVSWRRFQSGLQTDGIFVVRSIDGGTTFSRPVRVAPVFPFDQGTTDTSFRSNSFQTMTVDASGRVYVAWPQRGHASLRPDRVTGDARIVVSTSTTGSIWSPPAPIKTDGLGHQIMPAISFHAGKLRLVYYDLQEDVSQIFGPYVDELPILAAPDPKPPRHTIDVYVAQASPAAQPVFTATRLSDYAFGTYAGSPEIQRLQYNPPNLPLFRVGTAPFMGDYIDIASAPPFVQGTDGVWRFNLEPSTAVVSHGAWTDNRDVRAPADGNWTNYTPVLSDSLGTQSLFDPSQTVPPCVAGQTGMRNQNIYTAKITDGLFVGSPGNTKPLGVIPRAFVVIVENARAEVHSYRLEILDQPPGGQASFQQFDTGGGLVTVLDASIPPFSTIARTVHVTSTETFAQVRVSVTEIDAPGAAGPLPGGQASTIVLNTDPTNPSIQNPSIQNPSIQNPDIQVAEAYNPAITTAFLAPSIQNPSIQNPSIQNPSIQNPSIQNPELQNDAIANPSIIDPSIQNPSIQNPSIQNPSIQNPSIQNQDLISGAIQDTTWVVTNEGNTTASYAIKLLMNGALPDGFKSQLVLHKTYKTPAAQDCTLALQPHTVLVANIPDPAFAQVTDLANPSIQNPSIQNATISLAPGESANVTLRIVDPNRFDGVVFDAGAAVAPATVAHSVNTEDAAQGITTPQVAIPLTITTGGVASGTPGAAYSASLQTFAANGTTSWTVAEGTLPPGVTLDPNTGQLSGTPTTPGHYVFTVQATDSSGNVDRQTLGIKIDPQVPAGFSRTWNGADTNWANPNNWSPAGVPGASDRVYISAAIAVVPTLTRDETIRDLFVEDGATVDTNGFRLTITGTADAGQTIVGAGTTVLSGGGGSASGVFSNLEIAGQIVLSGALRVTGNLTLGNGAGLYLNGQSLIVDGQLISTPPGLEVQRAIPAIVGPASSAVVSGVNVNGLLLYNLPLRIDGGLLSAFDNVTLSGFASDAIQLTVNHAGPAAAFTMSGVAFWTQPTTGRLIEANDTSDDASTLVLNLFGATPADGSAYTAVTGGANVNWLSNPGDANLAIVQSVSPNPAAAGSVLTYTILVTNGGPAAATNVALSPGVPFGTPGAVLTTTQGQCTDLSGNYSCDLGTLAAGASVTVTAAYAVTGTGTVFRTAAVSANEPDPAPGNNSHTIGATLFDAGSGVNLTLTKSGPTDPVGVGVSFTYSLVVTNAGTVPASNVLVLDPVPAGVAITDPTATQGSCSIVSGQVLCNVGSLGPGQAATITLTASAAAPGLISNTGFVTSSEFELTPADNIASVQTLVVEATGCSAVTFTGPVSYQGSPGPTAVVRLVDMDHDGDLDAVATHETNGGGVDVFLNDGTGQFGPPRFTSTVTGPWIHVVADFNGDTHPDVITSSDREPGAQFVTLRLLTNDGTGTLTLSPTFSIPFGGHLAALDMDRDGDMDLVVASATSEDLVLLRNDGAGNFAAPVTLVAGTSSFSAFGDFNGDGHTDIVLPLGAAGYGIALADGAGGFLPPVVNAVEGGAHAAATADLDGDGRLDLLIVEGEGESPNLQSSVALGDGIGGFGPAVEVVSGSFVYFPTLADVNGDGRIDLVALSGFNAFAVRLGDGAGSFSAPVEFPNAVYYGPTLGDLNGDSRPDIAIGDRYGRLNVFLNNCGAPQTNLAVAVAESADPVVEGDELTYTLTVTNHTGADATGVRVTSVLSPEVSDEPQEPNVTVLAATSSAGGTLTSTGHTFTWTLPVLPGNSSVTFQFTFRTLGGGTLLFTSGVTSVGAETDPSDNTAAASTIVTAAGRTIAVTNTNDSGPGSLRQAIIESNDPGDVDTITFNIGAGGPQSITPLNVLPEIAHPVIIDGTTQPGFAGTPIVELNGNGLSAPGLFITSGGTTIRGLVINRFGQPGILISDGGGNAIEGNYIGTDLAGTVARPNPLGILVGSGNNRIGGTTAAVRNVISGNAGDGIAIDFNANGNVVQGNRVGTNAAGTAAIPNSQAGIRIFSSNNTVGGSVPGARNVISGNQGTAVVIAGGTATGNSVENNYIGTDVSGSAAVPNNGVQSGVLLGNGASNNTVANNVVSGNRQHGITVIGATSTGNTIRGNFVGTDPTGMVQIANGVPGVGAIGIDIVSAQNTVIGGPDGRNVIAGNTSAGIQMRTGASGTLVQNNYVGVNAAGTAAIANGTGIQLSDAANGNTIGGAAGLGNVISGSTNSGVRINVNVTGTQVLGNRIGTNAAGTAALPNQTGVNVTASNNTVAGNLISGNAQNGVILGAVSTGNTIQGNLIGTDASGALDLGNGVDGVQIEGDGNLIGGTTADARNVISGNQSQGVHIRTGASDNAVQGNYIGVNLAGTSAIGNGAYGVMIAGTSNTVGGTTAGAGNVLSGNGLSGVDIAGGANPPATGNQIVGNRIGTDAAGQVAVPNVGQGVIVFEGPNTMGGNLISGNLQNGVSVADAIGGSISGNLIGTNAQGTAALPNGNHGIWIVSGASGLDIADNVISGNTWDGVNLSDSQTAANLIRGNLIGTNAAGTAALGNRHGIAISDSPGNLVGGTTAEARNVISGNALDGILVSGTAASGNTIEGNYIGTNFTGTVDIGNGNHGILIFNSSTNTVGGTEPGAGNVISGNKFGLSVHLGTDNAIVGNFIGVNSLGLSALPNATHGVAVATNATNTLIRGNTLSGNLGSGVILNGGSTGTRVEGNLIGAAGGPDGSAPNGSNGVFIGDSSSNTIGGLLPAQSNVIAYNVSQGVVIVGDASVNNAILGNLIHSNVGLGIDLGNDGVTPNDPGDVDGSPNHFQNHPDLTPVAGGVSLSLNSTPNTTFRVELFGNNVCDPDNKGQGRTFLGALSVGTDASGNASVALLAAATGQYVTATATDPAGNTSEFSQCVAAGAALADLSITKTDSADPVVVNTPFTYTLTVQNAGPSAAVGVTITDNLPIGVTASSATSTHGSCTIDGRTVTCPVASLGLAEIVTVVVTVSTPTAGLITNQGTVTAAGTVDPNFLNDFDNEPTMVVAQACAAPTFSGPTVYPAGMTSLQLAAGDVNNDGSADIIASNGASSTVNLLLSNGAGAFLAPTPITVATDANSGASRVTVVDVNHDDNLDLVVTNAAPRTITVALGDGAGGFTLAFTSAALTNQPGRVETADFNEDGHLDLLVPHSPNLVMLLGDGTGAFGEPVDTPIPDVPAGGLSIGHFSPDTHIDVLLGSDGGPNVVIYPGDGLGGFANRVLIPTTTARRVVASGDVNGDARADILVQDFFVAGAVSLMTGVPGGFLSSPAPVGTGMSVFQLADASGDGHLDIIATSSSNEEILLVSTGSGTGSFSAPVTVAVGPPPRAAGDFNGDGRIDLAGRIGGSVGNTIGVFLNACGQPETDLSLDLTDSVDPVQEGAPVIYAATVTNHGTISASDVRVGVVFGGGASLTVTSSDASCSMVAGQRFLCALGTLAAGAARTIELSATAAAAGTISVDASVTAAQADPTPGNSTDSETTVVNAAGRDIVVTNTNATGPGSLDQAISDSNRDANDVDRIVFNIPGTGPFTITPTNTLSLTQPVVLDATTQPGFAGTPIVELDGTALSSNPLVLRDGLQVLGGNTTIRGLVINRFNSNGILIQGPGGNVVEGNFIGTNVAGTVALANGGNGVSISSSSGNRIGGTTAGQRNVIAGNFIDGVRIQGALSIQNLVQGNIIGLDGTGSVAIPNNAGVFVANGAINNTIGGTAGGAGNVISGNAGFGVLLQAGPNAVQGNIIGLNAGGNVDLGNDQDGVRVNNAPNVIIGGTDPNARNVISGNALTGITLFGTATVNSLIQGNFIGTRLDGNAAIGNTQSGISVQNGANGNSIGGTTTGAGNVISGNAAAGVQLVAVSNTLVQGNRIGTDPLSTAAVGNTGNGVDISDGSNNTIGGSVPAARNVISGNGANGVSLAASVGVASGNVVRNNFIGTNGNATSAIRNVLNGISINGATNTQIGGSGNVISGNGQNGIRIVGAASTGTQIRGNWIGTDSSGNQPVPNFFDGIRLDSANGVVIGSAAPADRNIIGGNAQHGIGIYGGTTGTVIQGNTIGGGGSPVNTGNALDGIQVNTGSNNTIGGPNANDGNFISFNRRAGVTVFVGTGNTILGNSIVANNSLGIDFANDLVTANDAGDADVGANQQQNYPILTPAPGGVTGTLNSTPNTTFRVEFFGNTSCDASGNGEGQTFLGALLAIATGADGNAAIPFLQTDTGGPFITATATDPAGNTSEFSACVQAVAQEPTPTTFTVTNTSDSGPGSLRQAILDANASAGTLDVIEFAIPGNGPHTIAPASPLPAIADPLIVDGTSQPGFSDRPIIELDGTSAGPNANGLEVTSGSSVIRGLVINRFGTGGSGAGGAGIALHGFGGNVIQGNFIGTDVTGTVALGNRTDGVLLSSGGNGIGGSNPGARNVISGNGRHGIFVAAGSVNSEIADNFIGVDRTGTAGLGNGAHGIAVNEGQAFIGTHFDLGTLAGAANVISGNGGAGISIEGDSSLHLAGLGVRLGGNRIGTDSQGTNPIPNGLEGVVIVNSSNNFVGGQSDGGNAIAFNTSHGVHVVSGINNYVAFNSVFSNGGLGINLGTDDVTPNDPNDLDAGANGVQNVPTLIAAPGGVAGSFNGAAGTIFQLHYYTNASCDPSGNGEGQTYFATASITTDASGNATLPFLAAPAGSIVTVTATDPAGNTSEFSACVTAEAAVVPTVTLTVINANTSEATADSTTFRFTRTGPTTDPLEVHYSIGGSNIGGDDFTPPLTATVTIPAGASSFDLTLTPVNDNEPEGPQILTLTVVAIQGTYEVGSPDSGSMTIADDDGAAIVANDATGAELGGDTLTFSISRGAAESIDVDRVVEVHMSGTATPFQDYTVSSPALSGTAFNTFFVTIPAGQSSVTVTVTPGFDVPVEGVETVIFTADGATASGEIADEPSATIAVVDAAGTELGSNNTLTFVVSRAAGASTAYDRPVEVLMSGTATPFQDYTVSSPALFGTAFNAFYVNIPAGLSSVLATVTPAFQEEVEGTETVVFTVEGTAATGDIADEAAVTIAVTDAAAAEQGEHKTLTFVVSRSTGSSAAYDRPVQVDVTGTATIAADYSVGGPAVTGTSSLVVALVMPSGQSSATITVTAIDDGVAESAETVIFSAEGTSATGTITEESTTTTRTWIRDGDGNWSDPANWSDGIVPQPDENVIIDRPGGEFVITIDGDFSVVNLRSEERVQVLGSSLTFGGNTQLNGGLTLSGGSLGGAGDLTLGGTSVWSGGILNGPGTTLIEAGAELNVNAPGQGGILHRSITNDGTLIWNQATLALANGARITNNASGRFEIQGNLAIANSSEGRTPLTNAGTLAKTGPGGAITLSGGIELATTGTIELRLGDGTNSDAIVSDAAGTLGGTLSVLLQGAFVPTVGQQFNVLQFSGRSGTFAAINGNGVIYDALYTATGLTLRAASGNAPPVANAGSDQTVPRNGLVQLDGSGSSDPEGGALTYQWTLIARPAGSAATLSDPTIANPTFTADQPGTYVAQLVVTDVLSSSGTDSVQITTANQAPAADAGPDQTGITPSSIVTLDGSASSDPDGDPITYSWSFVFRPVGSAATLTGANTASPTFLADLPGGYRIRLVVSDSFASSEDTVDVFTHLPPAGEQVSGPVAGLSYYNPAQVPNPAGATSAAGSSVSYLNPSPVPSPAGVVVAGGTSVSYYNPAPILPPAGAAGAASSSVSYYNPAPVPDPSGVVASGVTSVSYLNPAGGPGPGQQQQLKRKRTGM